MPTGFARKKKDGNHRNISKLSKLNKYIEYNHVKMDTLDHATTLITPGCFMVSIDLEDAYYSVLITVGE